MGLHNRFDKIISTHKRERERENVERRFRTCFIGALDSIEHHLGYLWGDDVDEADLTSQERRFLKIWKELRMEILDKGNNQLRQLLRENFGDE